jgi:sarcosine oxidase
LFDVAVIGLGAMGSATAFALAKRGKSIVAFDQYDPPHSHGSSHGESRMIRMAYFEDPSYVPLLRLAFDKWRDLEALTGHRVLTITGGLESGVAGSAIVQGSLRSAQEHGLSYQEMSPREVSERFPAFAIPHDWMSVYHADAGFLLPEKAIELFLRAAEGLGASISRNTRILGVRPRFDFVEIVLGDGSVVQAKSAVIAVGRWIKEFCPLVGRHLELTRQPLVWFDPTNPTLVSPDKMPVFLFETPDDLIYGFPDFCGSGVKAASHLSGGTISNPNDNSQEATDAERTRVAHIIEAYLPAAAGSVRKTGSCIYTRAPDEHFVLGLHPQHPQIVLASPCSGHGFKFSSIIGEILADLSTNQTTDKPIGLFHPHRFLT